MSLPREPWQTPDAVRVTPASCHYHNGPASPSPPQHTQRLHALASAASPVQTRAAQRPAEAGVVRSVSCHMISAVVMECVAGSTCNVHVHSGLPECVCVCCYGCLLSLPSRSVCLVDTHSTTLTSICHKLAACASEASVAGRGAAGRVPVRGSHPDWAELSRGPAGHRGQTCLTGGTQAVEEHRQKCAAWIVPASTANLGQLVTW